MERSEDSAPLTAAPGAPPSKPAFELSASRQFSNWLAERKASLAFTTYQAGKVFFIGLKPDGRLSIFERTLTRCMGMVAAGESLYVSTLYQIWRFENVLRHGERGLGGGGLGAEHAEPHSVLA